MVGGFDEDDFYHLGFLLTLSHTSSDQMRTCSLSAERVSLLCDPIPVQYTATIM